MSEVNKAADHYALKFPDRERATRKVSFEAGAEWRQEHPAPPFPETLPGTIDTSWCSPPNPCPTRPKRFLGRFQNRPWRCPTCTRWWTTEHRVTGGADVVSRTYVWIRAEAKR